MNIKILVAAHKAYQMPADPMYLPIHVGKEGKDFDLGYVGDNTGDNISLKNPNFCELTGIYWAWKNLEADYIGLAHYRRHFSLKKGSDKWASVLTTPQAEGLLQDTDVVLPKKRNYYIETVYGQYVHAHPAEGLDLALKLASQGGEDYKKACDAMKKKKKTHIYNMFLMKKEIFDGYCAWLFPILFEVERQVDISSYSAYDKRIFGFLSERLLDVYLEANGLSYQEIPVIFMEQQNWLKKGTDFLRRKFLPKKEG